MLGVEPLGTFIRTEFTEEGRVEYCSWYAYHPQPGSRLASHSERGDPSMRRVSQPDPVSSRCAPFQNIPSQNSGPGASARLRYVGSLSVIRPVPVRSARKNVSMFRNLVLVSMGCDSSSICIPAQRYRSSAQPYVQVGCIVPGSRQNRVLCDRAPCPRFHRFMPQQ